MLTPEIILLKTPSEQFTAEVEIVSRKNTSYLKQKMLMARRDVKLSLLSPAGRNVCRPNITTSRPATRSCTAW